MDERRADYLDVPGKFRLHRIIDVGRGVVIGNAAVTHWNGAAILWDINVDVKERRKYWAKSLITALQHSYRRITTSFKSEEGRKLCENCGFTMESGEHSNFSQLVWIKGVNKGET